MKTIREQSTSGREGIEMELGLRLKLFRVAAGLTQREVAQELEVSTNYVSMVERGKREPTLKYLKRFAPFAGIPVSVLFWEPFNEEGRESDVQLLHSRLAAVMAQYAAAFGVRST